MSRREQFRELKASSLWCGACKAERPVRERLLLVLPDGELHEYRCAVCLASVGTRRVGRGSAAPLLPGPGGNRGGREGV